MNDADRWLAKAQIGLAFFFSVFVFALVFSLIYYRSQMSSVEVTILTSLTSVLATILTLQMNFFFARTRPAALPDPTPPAPGTTVTTTTAPLTPPPTVTTTVTPPLAQPSENHT
jgi:protein-S-isoprenylcysteine O-methyltransferase Ste14